MSSTTKGPEGLSAYRALFLPPGGSLAVVRLSWTGGEDVYGVGQRDVATLYEYWVFLQLAEAVSRLCQEPLYRQALLDTRADGLYSSLAGDGTPAAGTTGAPSSGSTWAPPF